MFFNPNRKSYSANPYAALAALRAETPVFLSLDVQAWIITRYDVAADVLRDHEGFSASREHAVGAMAERMREDEARLPLKEAPLAGLDAPAHTRLRHVVNTIFHPRSTARWRQTAEDAAAELLAVIDAKAPFDLVKQLAEPLPVATVAPILGLPADQAAPLLGRLRLIENVRTAPGAPPAAVAASAEALAEVSALLDSSPDDPDTETLISTLRAAELTREISRNEALSLLAHVATVGLVPTAGLISNGVHALIEHPEQFAALRDKPELAANAVHELARYDTPIHAIPRLATQDQELAGRKIRKGDPVFVMLGGANRDPEVFPDPDELDVTRDSRLHLGFGIGPHICLGAPLARMVTEVAIGSVLERFRGLRLVPGGSERAPGFERRVFTRLVVRDDARM